MGSAAEWASAVASLFAFLAAIASWRTALATERRERVQRTIDAVEKHRANMLKHWHPLSDAVKTRLHALDWSASPRPQEIREILEAFNSGERLGEEFRSNSLDTATLIRLEGSSGSGYPYLSAHVFPAIRAGLDDSQAYEAFESLLRRCYERLPFHEQAAARKRAQDRTDGTFASASSQSVQAP